MLIMTFFRREMIETVLAIIALHATTMEAMGSIDAPVDVPLPAAAVVLGTTLQQGSLCRGEGTATFTCTAIGTDLIWIVGGRMMSYNANALVGAIRSNAQSDQTAILMRVENRDSNNGVANRMSVLTISARPSATEPLTVKCHNGSTNTAKVFSFLRSEAGTLNQPQIQYRQEMGRLHTNWSVPDINEVIHTIDYYSVQMDNSPPMHTKNSSATFPLEQHQTNHTIQLHAIDSCGRKSEQLRLSFSGTIRELTSEVPTVDTEGFATGSKVQVHPLIYSLLLPIHMIIETLTAI